MPMKWTYKIFMNSQFEIQANYNDHKKFQKDLLIRSTSKLILKIFGVFFDFFFWGGGGSVVTFEIHGCCSSELVDPTYKNFIQAKIVVFQKVK